MDFGEFELAQTAMAEKTESGVPTAESKLGFQAESSFSLTQRVALWVVPRLTQILLLLLGRTLRFEYSWESKPLRESTDLPPAGAIVPFWHSCLLCAAYYFRGVNAVIMVSRSFDGELIARVLNRLGYRTVRGSSTHGAVSALLGMRKEALQDAFTIFAADGPTGPRFVAKPGPLLLARRMQRPIYCFYLAPRRAWELDTWDRLLIPKPFTKVHLCWSQPLEVPADASSGAMKVFHQQMQAALESARAKAETQVIKN